MIDNGVEDKHFFNLGIRRNYREIFGTSVIHWFLPTWSSIGDGSKFADPRKQDSEEGVSWSSSVGSPEVVVLSPKGNGDSEAAMNGHIV